MMPRAALAAGQERGIFYDCQNFVSEQPFELIPAQLVPEQVAVNLGVNGKRSMSEHRLERTPAPD